MDKVITYVNLERPYARIKFNPLDRQEGIYMLQEIERTARISHRSEEKFDTDTWERFIKAVVLQHGDWSVTEHRSVTVECLVDRGVTHEWVRHRLGAYTQESTRFVNYEKKRPAAYIKPELLPPNHMNLDQAVDIWLEAIDHADIAYRRLVGLGVAPQVARSVFPTALASRIDITYNLRMWRHFFIMRTTKEAHPQMREVAIPLLEEFKEKIPLLYDDIEPNARQADNMRLPR